MPKFTPGPWHVGMRPGPIVYGPKGVQQIADCRAFDYPENIPNAQAIASFPTIYSAARDAFEFLRNCTTEEFSQGEDHEIRKQLASALTLADGEERNL